LMLHVHGYARVSFQFVKFVNPRGRDSAGECCDGRIGICITQCDHVFTFCFDRSNGDSDIAHCEYDSYTTGEYRDQNNVEFNDHNMKGVVNPITLRFGAWPGAIKLKVKVKDDDTGHSNHDHVDNVAYTWTGSPSRAYATRTIHPYTINGQRGKYITKLTVNISSWCEDDYYGPSCIVHCQGRSDSRGHYTCDPASGSKVCMAGWEDVSTNCLVLSDDCLSAPCQNGATCIDGNRFYTCVCLPGFIGDECDINVNECASSPCINGQCGDMVAGYHCYCPSDYVGIHCEHHVCDATVICRNNGTCINSGQCMCSPGYTGSTCEIDLCDVIDCRNNGTCMQGMCSCPEGYVGPDCSVDVCDHHACHHNSTCTMGSCLCDPYWTGSHCEWPINSCEAEPCHHLATCKDLDNGYLCQCLPQYEGAYCETEVVNKPIIAPAQQEDSDTTGAVEDRYSNTSLIVGLIFGVILAFILILVIILFNRYHRKAKLREDNAAPPNFNNPLYDSEHTASPVGTQISSAEPASIYPAIPDEDENPYACIGGATAGDEPPLEEKKLPLPDLPPDRKTVNTIYDTPRSEFDVYDHPPIRYPPPYEDSNRGHDNAAFSAISEKQVEIELQNDSNERSSEATVVYDNCSSMSNQRRHAGDTYDNIDNVIEARGMSGPGYPEDPPPKYTP